MDLTTLRLEVRERLGELESDFFSDAEVDRAINEAVKRFCAEEPWPWLITEFTSSLTSGNDELEFPENVSPNRVFNISVLNGSLAYPRMLERLEPSAGFRARYSRISTGIPLAYYITRTEDDAGAFTYIARVVPSPDVNYDVEGQYIAVPDDLTGVGDIPMIPDEYQEAVPARAAGKLFLKEQQISQKASEQFGIYFEVLQQAREEMQNVALDETVAWGREMPLSRIKGQNDYVMRRINPLGLGQ